MATTTKFQDLVDVSQKSLQLLGDGIYLTTRGTSKNNTMIISWGTIGQMWNKPVVMVMVRASRYSHDLLENTKEFTLTLPKASISQEALKIAGAKSGRDMDKFEQMTMPTKASKSVSVPIIEIPAIQMECNLLFKSEIMPDGIMAPEIINDFYSDHDFHTLYFGEIIELYETN